MLTMKQFSQQLVDAFSKIVEYQPFCRYENNGMVTVEWNKSDSEMSFALIQKNKEFTNIIRL